MARCLEVKSRAKNIQIRGFSGRIPLSLLKGDGLLVWSRESEPTCKQGTSVLNQAQAWVGSSSSLGSSKQWPRVRCTCSAEKSHSVRPSDDTISGVIQGSCSARLGKTAQGQGGNVPSQIANRFFTRTHLR